MIESSNSFIDSIVVHQMGCKAEGGELRLSRGPIDMTGREDVADLLRLYFFRPFTTDSYFNLTSETGPEGNEVFRAADDVFAGKADFYQTSIQLARRLFEASNHPKIRGGEIYMSFFRGCVVDGQVCDAVGIFKSESKETFLRIMMGDEHQVELGSQEGINIKKLDKGCIIFNLEREDGYRVCAVDNINKGQEARFWMDDFLGLKPREDSFFYTDSYLKMCKGFVNDVFNDQNHVTRAEQIDLMNKSIDFFKKNSQFSNDQFEQSVMVEPNVIDAFNEYRRTYEQNTNLQQPLPQEFDVSADAVRQEKKNFKAVIKLDKNFHIYVHGSRYYMEKGYDKERDMNYYKLFFKVEE